MMAVLEAILPAVARSSGISLQLYRVAASSHNAAARDLIKAASTINNFASTLKQIGTIIKEDDRLPSSEVCRHFSFIQCTATLSPRLLALCTAVLAQIFILIGRCLGVCTFSTTIH
jgi:hypothetical protein